MSNACVKKSKNPESPRCYVTLTLPVMLRLRTRRIKQIDTDRMDVTSRWIYISKQAALRTPSKVDGVLKKAKQSHCRPGETLIAPTS